MTLQEFLQKFASGLPAGSVWALGIAILGGVVSSAVCPCTLPVGLGMAGAAGASETQSRRGGFMIAIAFFAGIIVNLTILGALASRLGGILTRVVRAILDARHGRAFIGGGDPRILGTAFATQSARDVAQAGRYRCVRLRIYFQSRHFSGTIAGSAHGRSVASRDRLWGAPLVRLRRWTRVAISTRGRLRRRGHAVGPHRCMASHDPVHQRERSPVREHLLRPRIRGVALKTWLHFYPLTLDIAPRCSVQPKKEIQTL